MEQQSEGKWMLYGANGYTGQLICEEAARRGLNPILAGRTEAAIQALAKKFGWEYRIFALDEPASIAVHLERIKVVLHAAGPFRFTARNMIQACLLQGVHYLDIAGEIDVFELAAGLHQEALKKNIMLMPGTGFDVVPTDCLGLRLKERMPDANSIELAFVTLGGQVSHGTAMSMSEKIGEGGMIRSNGVLTREPLGQKSKILKLDNHEFFVMSIPWGDIFTCYHTTGIPNIRAYTGAPKMGYWFLKLQRLYLPVLRSQWFKRWLQKKINERPAGPTAEKRASAITYVWGEVANTKGEKISEWFKCPDGYTLTAITAVDIAQHVLNDIWTAGFQTPAGCYGAQLIAPYTK